MSYPAILNLKNRLVLVVGGGAVARRKVEGLLEAKALVRLVSPQALPELVRLAQRKKIDWLAREYDSLDLEGCWLAVAATDREEVNLRVAEEAEAAGIWVNVADRPDLCGFTVPAHFRQGDLLISVSTGGASPLLAAAVKNDLARSFDQAWGEYCDLLAALRARVLRGGQASAQNRKIFEAVLKADLLTPLRSGDREDLASRLNKATGFTLEELEAAKR